MDAEAINMISDKIQTFFYEFKHDSSLARLGVQEEIQLALEDNKKEPAPPHPEVEGVQKDLRPPFCLICDSCLIVSYVGGGACGHVGSCCQLAESLGGRGALGQPVSYDCHHGGDRKAKRQQI